MFSFLLSLVRSKQGKGRRFGVWRQFSKDQYILLAHNDISRIILA